ncbi:YcaO-like family protein [Anaerocolumna sp. MB42-C2]|uniref:YcaO-like family protein n=1 Tax=Anaerocolumna sp. MB42-C2 TaxID=3070997 RepID=UPI0027DEC423|nr:YcaO-like family protein [Anaerocolumna sp. MB42-C2]WMJ86457.1 YcaO-like family protein [Anaerocolumna sp. MB42-C2]
MKFMSKECEPIETINRIKDILAKYNLNVCEKNWVDNEMWYSVRLEFENLPGVGTNGKGITKEYALASAYAEFMERLQSRSTLKTVFGNKNRSECFFPDEKLETVEYVYNISKKLFAFEFIIQKGFNLQQLLHENSDYCYCAPFMDLQMNQQVNLPMKLIRKLCGTNGLCAGNTETEAVIQGICEIYERHVHHMIFFEGLQISTIDLGELKHLNCYKQILCLESLGYECFVKDCTAGIFPVIGLVIWDKETLSYSFTIGAHYDIDIALQRCITEAFQGYAANKIEFNRKMTPFTGKDIEVMLLQDIQDVSYHTEWVRSVVNNTGYEPHSIFHSGQSRIYSDVFLKEGNNDIAYLYLLEIAEKNGYKVYSRDLSFMGFPTYQVFISGITAVNYLYNAEFPILANEDRVREVYLNLNGASRFERAWFFEVLSSLRDIPRYKIYGYPMIFFDLLLRKPIKALFPDNLLFLSYGYLSLNDLDGASKYLYLYVKENNLEDSSRKFAEALIFAYRYILYNPNFDGLEKFLPNSIDMCDITDLIKNAKDALSSFELPSCGDCTACGIKKYCMYEEWEKINGLIQPAMNRFFYRNSKSLTTDINKAF